MWLHFIPLPGQSKSSIVVQLLTRFQAHQTSLSFTISQSLLKLMSIESVMPSNDLILCHPLLLLPSVFPSIRLFVNQSALRFRWPKYWSFSFSISPSNEYSGLISFRMDWFDLLSVQGTLHSSLALQFESINSLALSMNPLQFTFETHQQWLLSCRTGNANTRVCFLFSLISSSVE